MRWLSIISFIFISVLALQRAQQIEAQARGREPVINCKDGHQNQPLVRDFDGRLWRVDICAVAQDDAGASQYKTEVR